MPRPTVPQPVRQWEPYAALYYDLCRRYRLAPDRRTYEEAYRLMVYTNVTFETALRSLLRAANRRRRHELAEQPTLPATQRGLPT